MKQSVIPWIISAIMGIYVYGLTYYAHHRLPPAPSYEFYDTSWVTIEIKGTEEASNVYGRFNNILEGKHQIIRAKPVGEDLYRLIFKVNSPRPAILYVDDEDLEIFLMPGDTSLKVSLNINPITYQIDSLVFLGKTAGICQYFQDKSAKFRQVGLRANRNLVDSENFEGFSLKLDSLASMELGFLAEHEVYNELPDWFVDFEKSEILYHKAYLKLSNGFNRDVPINSLDTPPTNNEDAVFSYYYYLYLNTYLSNLVSVKPLVGNDSKEQELSAQIFSSRQLAIADSLLVEGTHDVFMTRVLFGFIKRKQYDFVKLELRKYKDRFFRKKYYRFLKMQLEKSLESV